MDESNNLEKLKKRLYKKEESFPSRLDRESLRSEKEKILPYWKENAPSAGKKSRFFDPVRLIIYLSGALFLIIGGFFLYLLFSGSNVISSSNITITASGPVSVDGGQPAKFSFTIKNQNETPLEMADLIFDFPSNSFSPEGDQMTRTRIPLDDVGPGEIVNESVDAVFFGTENEEKKLKATLEYRLADSNAIFVKETEYTVRIIKAPLGITVSVPKEAASGQEVAVKVEIVSNSESVARNLRMEMKYPPGFRFIDAEPEPRQSSNVWLIGDLGPNQKNVITINGTVEGENAEERIFVSSVGLPGEGGELRVYGSASEKISIKKSPLNLSVVINGKDQDKNIVYPGDSVRVDLEWVNNLLAEVRDAQIETEIEGEAYDPRTLSVSRGFYRSSDDKIVWNPSTLGGLGAISSGKSGKSQLSFYLQNPLPDHGPEDKDFSVKITARIFGRGTSNEFENREISDMVEKNIIVGSRLQGAGHSLYYSGPFANSGPMPPKAGSETSYTVTWSLAGNINNLSGVKIKSSLPPYVTLTGQKSPAEADLFFDDKTGELTWNLGELPAGTGIISPAKELSFQISFAPSLSQIGETPILINAAKIEAMDDYTGEEISGDVQALSIKLSGDPQTKTGDDKVIE